MSSSVGTARESPPASPPGSTAGIARGPTSGRTRTTPRESTSTRLPAFPRSPYIPNLNAQRAQILATCTGLCTNGSSYVIADLDGGFTKYYEGTLEAEWRGKQDLRPRHRHVQPLLRQLRPGQHDRGRQRHEHLHRVVQHRRRRGTPALELQVRQSPRATVPIWSRSTAPAFCPGMAAWASSSSPSQGSRGRSRASSPTGA